MPPSVPAWSMMIGWRTPLTPGVEECWVVTGVPGAGKTTLGSALAVALGAPFLSLDAIKENLYAGGEGTQDRYGLRLAAERELVVQLTSAGATVAVDLWIAPGRDTERITALLQQQARKIVEVLCRVPADVAVARYARRRRSGPHLPPDEMTLRRIREASDVLRPWGLATASRSTRLSRSTSTTF